MSSSNPEIGLRVDAAGISTNYHDRGQGYPVLMIHGSGPGVTGWANWRLNIEHLAQTCRVIVPDMVGFGYTEIPPNIEYNLETWIEHLVSFLDALNLQSVDVVGNSFGGAVALALAIRYPARVRKLVLMGSVGTTFTLTPGLDAVWGYTPSVENMRALLDVFAYDRNLVSDDLAELRYRASIRAGTQEAFSQMFSPSPRQKYIEALASREEDIAALANRALIIHGREDRVIPLSNSLKLASLIPDAQLHVFPRCGHWTQIEWAASFNRLVGNFLTDDI